MLILIIGVVSYICETDFIIITVVLQVTYM